MNKGWIGAGDVGGVDRVVLVLWIVFDNVGMFGMVDSNAQFPIVIEG